MTSAQWKHIPNDVPDNLLDAIRICKYQGSKVTDQSRYAKKTYPYGSFFLDTYRDSTTFVRYRTLRRRFPVKNCYKSMRERCGAADKRCGALSAYVDETPSGRAI
jgi:hypothetical protein